MDTARRQWRSGAVLLVLLVGVALRFYAIGAKTVWLDEAFSVWVARHDLWEQWRWLVKIDQHPPLYYGLLHVWIQLFGDLQGAVRALSALCSALALPFFYAAARRLIDGPTALVALLILAVSPFHVRFAQETRMYGLLTLTVAVALFFLARVLTAPHAPRRYWIGLAVAQAAVMLTHNTATVYFPAALNLAIGVILWRQRSVGKTTEDAEERRFSIGGEAGDRFPLAPGFARRWLGYQGLAFLLWAPWAVPFVIQSIGVDREFWLWPPTLGMVWSTFRNFDFAFLPGGLPFQSLWMALYGLFVLLGVHGLRRSPPRRILLLSLLFTPMAIALLVSLRRPIYYDRTLVWLTLPYYLLMAVGIRALGYSSSSRSSAFSGVPTWRHGAQWAALALILALSGLSLDGYYFRFQKEGWDQAAAYVAQNVRPEDVIVFNATWVQIPFEYYYRHYGKATELRGLPVDLFDRGVLEPKMTEADVPYLRKLVQGRKRVWLVYSHDWYTDENGIIPREMAQVMHETERRKFTGLQVIRYDGS